MKLFDDMTPQEKLHHIEYNFRELRPLLEEYLTTPLADIWDWEERNIPWLIERVRTLESQLRFAAGMISTTGEFASKHPEEALKFIEREFENIGRSVCVHGSTDPMLCKWCKAGVPF